MIILTLARRPMSCTIVANSLAYGTGGLNIDACRISVSTNDAEAMTRCNTPGSGRMKCGGGAQGTGTFSRSNPTGKLDTAQGRWPSNIFLSEDAEVLRDFPEARAGVAVGRNASAGRIFGNGKGLISQEKGIDCLGYGDSGSAARFFKVVKS